MITQNWHVGWQAYIQNNKTFTTSDPSCSWTVAGRYFSLQAVVSRSCIVSCLQTGSEQTVSIFLFAIHPLETVTLRIMTSNFNCHIFQYLLVFWICVNYSGTSVSCQGVLSPSMWKQNCILEGNIGNSWGLTNRWVSVDVIKIVENCEKEILPMWFRTKGIASTNKSRGKRNDRRDPLKTSFNALKNEPEMASKPWTPKPGTTSRVNKQTRKCRKPNNGYCLRYTSGEV